MEKERHSPHVQIPDAINCTAVSSFTRVPNDMLRDPSLSAKAKGLLCLLLSNQKGEWHNYIKSLVSMTRDGESAIRTGLAELESAGYLHHLRYLGSEEDSK